MMKQIMIMQKEINMEMVGGENKANQSIDHISTILIVNVNVFSL